MRTGGKGGGLLQGCKAMKGGGTENKRWMVDNAAGRRGIVPQAECDGAVPGGELEAVPGGSTEEQCLRWKEPGFTSVEAPRIDAVKQLSEGPNWILGSNEGAKPKGERGQGEVLRVIEPERGSKGTG